ncbi:MAG: hypothetical protein L7W43_18045 [Rubripirellula sp.]|nr:hypothetical protein [Rubripirellula sp.]
MPARVRRGTTSMKDICCVQRTTVTSNEAMKQLERERLSNASHVKTVMRITLIRKQRIFCYESTA